MKSLKRGIIGSRIICIGFALSFVTRATAAPKAPVNPAPKVKYNYVKDMTEVSSPTIELENAMPNALAGYGAYKHTGKQTTQPPEKITLVLMRRGKRVDWSAEDTLYVRYGDIKKNFPATTAKDHMPEGFWFQTAIIPIPFDDFLLMTAGDALHFQLGSTTSAFTEDYLKPLTELAQYAKDPKPKETPTSEQGKDRETPAPPEFRQDWQTAPKDQ